MPDEGMKYFIFPLKFDSPVHFGNGELGGDLTNCGIEFASDAFINALLHELRSLGDEQLMQKLSNLLDERRLIFSDLLPYVLRDEMELYLPKPVMLGKVKELSDNLEQVRQQATVMKAQKKINYIRSTHLEGFVNSLRGGGIFSLQGNRFADKGIVQRVFIRPRESSPDMEPVPYFVGANNFRDGAGLYVIAGLEDADDVQFVENLIEYVGLSGIGGKRSSGYGKYHILRENISASADMSELVRLLERTDGEIQMSLSTVLPAAGDVGVLAQSWYKLKQRSGFISGLHGDVARKKNSIYMLAAGACFPHRVPGTCKLLGCVDDVPVKRYGYGMYVGL